jgi:hypothetical protein
MAKLGDKKSDFGIISKTKNILVTKFTEWLKF